MVLGTVLRQICRKIGRIWICQWQISGKTRTICTFFFAKLHYNQRFLFGFFMRAAFFFVLFNETRAGRLPNNETECVLLYTAVFTRTVDVLFSMKQNQKKMFNGGDRLLAFFSCMHFVQWIWIVWRVSLYESWKQNTRNFYVFSRNLSVSLIYLEYIIRLIQIIAW